MDEKVDYWLMGTNFMQGYYTIFDNDDHSNARLGFAPHTDSSKVKIDDVRMPTTDVMDILWETTWVGLLADPSIGGGFLTLYAKVHLFFWGWIWYDYPTTGNSL